MMNAVTWHRSELGAAGLAFAVAILVAKVIIPPVLADTAPLAAPESAAASFWMAGVLANVVVGAMLLGTALLGCRWSVAGQVTAGAAGLALLVIGALLLLPVFVFAAHGPSLAGARLAMAVGAAGNFAASALTLAAAGLLHRFREVVIEAVHEMKRNHVGREDQK